MTAQQLAPVCMSCERKVPHLSELLATNAAWLHRAVNPHCPAVDAYACGDHWHVGHRTRADREACEAGRTPRPRYRPRHRAKRSTS